MTPSDRRISWCLRQKKGIRMEEPNDGLCKSYLKEANDSLVSMNANMKAGLRKWVIITAYYARYHAIYALLRKAGIKSEIHDCSIALVKYLFSGIFDREFFAELEESKEQRINLQYYTNRTVSDSDYERNMTSSREFVLRVEKAIDSLTFQEISRARERLSDLLKKRP